MDAQTDLSLGCPIMPKVTFKFAWRVLLNIFVCIRTDARRPLSVCTFFYTSYYVRHIDTSSNLDTHGKEPVCLNIYSKYSTLGSVDQQNYT